MGEEYKIQNNKVDWTDENDDLFEAEVEEDNDNFTINNNGNEYPFDADKIRYDIKTISIRQMNDMLGDKQLDLNPGFQRRVVWTEKKRKSLLIESLMLRIPLPGFYVYEDDDTIWHVVDGLQRMSTIKEFLNDEFALSGLKYLSIPCDGKRFSQLEQKYKNRITLTSLVVNVIDSRTPPEVKMEIFRRINTGGKPLNAQEIRNSTAKEHIREFLTELVNSDEFIMATNGGINDTRMQAQELILRFIAFYDAYNFQTGELKYNYAMDSFLDIAFDKLNKANKKQLEKYQILFCSAMRNSNSLFGRHAFRKILSSTYEMISTAKLNPYNKSLFTCTSVILANFNSMKIEQLISEDVHVKEIVLLKFIDAITNNKQFDDSISKGTGDLNNIQIQFMTMKQILCGGIGCV